jgi:hypothetical protein
MRYLMLIELDPSLMPADGPDQRLMDDMNALIEEMTKAGVLLDTAGLHPRAEGVRLEQAGGKQRVIDGPFIEAKEVIGGYSLIQVKSQDEAAEWAKRFLAVHGPEWTVAVEIRELAGPE